MLSWAEHNGGNDNPFESWNFKVDGKHYRNNVCEYLETLKADHEALAIDLVVVALWIVVGVLAYRSFKNGK